MTCPRSHRVKKQPGDTAGPPGSQAPATVPTHFLPSEIRLAFQGFRQLPCLSQGREHKGRSKGDPVPYPEATGAGRRGAVSHVRGDEPRQTLRARHGNGRCRSPGEAQ